MTRLNYKRVYELAYGPVPARYDIHHKVPKHSGGTDDAENLVALSRPDHAQAHYELFQLYGDSRDLVAYKMLNGWPVEPDLYAAAAAARGRTRHSRYPEFSSQLGKKYGPLNRGSYHYNDGQKGYRYSKSQAEEKNFEQFLRENPQFRPGRLPSPEFKKSREGWVILTDGEKDHWLPKEWRGRLEEYLKLNPHLRAGRSNRKPFKRRTKLEMQTGLPRPSKRRV